MRVQQFGELLKNNNAIRLNEEYIVFNDFELYSFKTQKKKKYKTLEELVEANDFVKEIIASHEAFELEYAGGRGAGSTSSEMGGGFGHADQRGRGGKQEVLLNAELNINTAKGNSYESVLKRFREKYGTADREYAVAIDENGYVHQHVKGGKVSVAITGNKGETIIHNHPSGGNFSDTDLITTASTKAKGIVATSSRAGVTSTYKFTKNENFKAKEFIKAVKRAQWSTDLDYDRGADWWLKKNQKTYGYKYSHTGNFAKS